MLGRITICVFLIVAVQSVSAEHPVSLALGAESKMNWRPYEVHGVQDKLAAIRALGLCVVDDLYTPEHFHFVDINGDGVADVVYEGPAIDCERASEGWETKLFLGQDGAAVLLFQRYGSIRALWRESDTVPVSFILRDAGCCGTNMVRYGYFEPAGDTANPEFALARSLMRLRRMELPKSYLNSERVEVLSRPSTVLRRTSEVVDTGRVYPLDHVGVGNALEMFPANTQVIVVSVAHRSDGRWLFVAAPFTAAERERSNSDEQWREQVEILGWMKADVEQRGG